jgi:hypothetical protein
MTSSRTPRPASAAEVPELSESEHIFIGSEDLSRDPKLANRAIGRAEMRNPLRHTVWEITLFEEGIVEIVERTRAERAEAFRLDLQYLDPIPSIRFVVAKRAFWLALGAAAAAGGALLLADLLPIIGPAALVAAVLAGLTALGAAAFGIYRSHETIEFHTLHGRARVIKLVANVGAIKRFRAFVPKLSGAIEESAERISQDASAYLRAEMREHYRLRGAGVLSSDECAESTGRILSYFDVQL